VRIKARSDPGFFPQPKASNVNQSGYGTMVGNVSLFAMKWVLLSHLLAGSVLYFAGAYVPISQDCPAPTESVATVRPDDRQTPAIVPTVRQAENDPQQNQLASIQTSERQSAPSDELAATSPKAASRNLEQANRSWGALKRVAPVHSGPSASSPIVGYGAAGTEMPLVERQLGWVRVLDPATSREGWIYEDHVSASEGASELPAEGSDPEAMPQSGREATQSDGDLDAIHQPQRSFKVKKPRQHYAKKRWRKPLRFVRRFAR
jgi:hypothetical protein